MLNYINELKSKLEQVKNEYNIEKDGYKKVDLNIEIVNLEDQMNFCINLVINNFSNEDALTIGNENLSPQVMAKALEDATHYNDIEIFSNIDKMKNEIVKTENKIKDLLEKFPDIETKDKQATYEYYELITSRKNIENLNKKIESEKNNKKTFIDFLDFDNKFLLANKMLENPQKGKETVDELFVKVKAFLPKLDLLCKAKYPVNDRFNELTENKNDDLAKYLKENEENIKRLEVNANNDVISNYYTIKVNKIENVISKKRIEIFNKMAKEKGYSNIINPDSGYFNSKVYKSQENYNLFKENILEIQVSTETKDKIKRLLKKLDSLEILDDYANANESPYKEYGFTRFVLAKGKFVEAMEENPADEHKIKDTLENLKNEEKKILEMYQMIQDELGDSYDTMPGNVDSYRNVFIPPHFKDNLSINAKFNSLFIMLTFIKEKNLDIDNFIDNPVSLTELCLRESVKKTNIDEILKGKTKAEAFLHLTDKRKIAEIEQTVKYSRSFELIYKSETNPLYIAENEVTVMALNNYFTDINRSAYIGASYFEGNQFETIQNIYMAKKDDEGKISYLDCFVTKKDIQENPITGVLYDEKPTIVEQIQTDQDIEATFYEAVNTLRDFTLVRGDKKSAYFGALDSCKMLSALQTLACKIIVTLDLRYNSTENSRNLSPQFIQDVYNIIADYKKVDALKDFNYQQSRKHQNSMIGVVNNRVQLAKDYEVNMRDSIEEKEEAFIREFERINREIDELDKRADKIGEKLGQGKTNKAIEDIAAEQQRKFMELRNLQNDRIKDLKEDVKSGAITKLYFEKRSEQVLLLENIKDIPPMFECDNKKYKNFKSYAKEMNIDLKGLNHNYLQVEEAKYNTFMEKSAMDKRLHLINNVLAVSGLSMRKSINYEKIDVIKINDHIEEMVQISDQLLSEEQRIKNEKEIENRKPVNVGYLEEERLISEQIIEQEENNVKVQKN